MFDKLAALLIEAVLRAMALLPLPVAHGLGWLLGSALWLVPNPARKHARINLDVCLPELDKRERRRLLRRSLQELGKTITEMGTIWYGSTRRLNRLVVQFDGRELMEQAMASGNGMLCVVPHLGAWELLPVYFAQFLPANAMYRPPRLTAFDRILSRVRTRTGCRQWPASPAGVRGAFKALRQGEVLAILPDQAPVQEGVYAAFFGVPAKTMTLVPRLAQKTPAKVLMLVAQRLPFGRGYRVRYLPTPEAIADADLHTATTAMNAAIEEQIRALPEQYQWTYRRFRNQPVGVKSPYSHPREFAASLEAWKARGRPHTPQRKKKRRNKG